MAAVLLLVVAAPAQASGGYLRVPPDEVRQASPAFRYANLTNEQAYAELDRRAVRYRKVGRIGYVRAPVRLTGPLHGVLIHSSLPEKQRSSSIFEVLDARLALALDDFATLLERHDIVELVHYTMYRPNGPQPGQAGAGSRRQGRRKGKRAGKGSARGGKHPGRRKGKRWRSGKRHRSHAKGLGKAATQPKRKRSGKRHPKQKTVAEDETGKQSRAATGGGAQSRKAKRGAKGSANKRRNTHKGRRPGKRRASKGRRHSGKRRASGRKRGAHRRGGGKRRRTTATVHKKLWAPPGTRHPAGLAIDVGALRKRDGRWLSVAHHFEGQRGAATCGPRATVPKTPEGRELRSLVCECADALLFTYVLTPNYDAAHADHLHMEIRGDVKIFSYH